MKKLSILVAVGSLALAAPVFACPGHDTGDTAAPKTAEKAPAKDDKAAPDKAKDTAKTAPAKDTAKDTAKATPSKETPKKPDKVSQK